MSRWWGFLLVVLVGCRSPVVPPSSREVVPSPHRASRGDPAARPFRCVRADTSVGPELAGWTVRKARVATWTAVAVSTLEGNEVWAVGEGGAVLRTRDGGASFEACTLEPAETLGAVSVVSADDVWILGERHVYHVENGATVATVPFVLSTHCGAPSNGIFADAHHVWIANGKHYRSDDRGKTWTPIRACGAAEEDACASELWGHGNALWSDCAFGITGTADGVHWTRAEFDTRTEEQLHVGVGPDDVWAMGQDTRTIGRSRDGRVWSVESLGDPTDGARAWSITSAGRGWAWVVASDGLWVRRGVLPWVREGKGDLVRAVAVGPRTVWAVGADGLVAHRPRP